VLLLSTQVAFRCFYTATHNKNLYPTFARVSGRVGIRYANIFKHLVQTFGLKKFVLIVDQHQQAAVDMTTYITKALIDVQADSEIRPVNQVNNINRRLSKLKEEGTETGMQTAHV